MRRFTTVFCFEPAEVVSRLLSAFRAAATRWLAEKCLNFSVVVCRVLVEAPLETWPRLCSDT